MFDVVLYQPEIPPNTGNIIRLCANTGARLHLVEPLGFTLEDRALKRAGLDYHEYAEVQTHASFAACMALLSPPACFAFSTRGTQPLAGVSFPTGSALVFGAETSGLPPAVFEQVPPACRVRLPMRPASRSLNLSNAVAVVVYEAWRQHAYAGAVHSSLDTDADSSRRK